MFRPFLPCYSLESGENLVRGGSKRSDVDVFVCGQVGVGKHCDHSTANKGQRGGREAGGAVIPDRSCIRFEIEVKKSVRERLTNIKVRLRSE